MMKSLFFGAIAHVSSLVQKIQVKRFLAVVLTGFVLLTTNFGWGQSNSTANKVDRAVHESDSQRPKTTGEWMNEAKEDVPLGQRVRDVAEDSAEAFKDFGSLYPDTAERSSEALKDNATAAGRQK